jgi:dual specificity phosphatase 12
MNEITQNLWLGDLPSALNVQQLRKNRVDSVLSVMPGELKINEVATHSLDPCV